MEGCRKITFRVLLILGFLFLVVGLPLILVFAVHHPKNPTFTVESSAVKAYNLTVDNRLICIINLGVRARNPNPNPKKDTFRFNRVDMEVRKGKHHKLADDALGDFSLGPAGEAVIPVEAVGLSVGLKRKIAEELKGDVVAGEGRVNVFMSGKIGINNLRVSCSNVVVDFSRSRVMIQTVGCEVSVTNPYKRGV